MKPIQIDDEVYTYLEKNAKPFEETTPNMTLRRLLGLNKTSLPTVRSEVRLPATIPQPDSFAVNHRRRERNNPKVNIRSLIAKGFVQLGQTLYLYDYRRKRVSGYEATLDDWGLIWNGTRYSMSDLAKQLLQKVGYQSDSVRGPMHWGTADGVTIKDMWEKCSGSNGTH